MFVSTENVYQVYSVLCPLFGTFLGAVVALCPLSTVDLVTLQEFSIALGFQQFVGGSFSGLGGPFIGEQKM